MLQSSNCDDLPQYERIGNLEPDLPSDSGSETIPDLPISKAFPDHEWDAIQVKFFGEKGVKKLYDVARKQSFDNHAGKLFVTCFIEVCCAMIPNMGVYVNSSSATSGAYQPGSSSFVKTTVRSTPSSSRSTPSGDGGAPTTRSINLECDRFSDGSFWNVGKQLYPISFEVKSKDKQPAATQCTEQMFGLYRENQKAMLGIVVKPNRVSIQIMTSDTDSLQVQESEEYMSLLEMGTIKKLARYIIAFLYFIDC